LIEAPRSTAFEGNAHRLLRIGTTTGQADTTSVMPAISAELAARQEAKSKQKKIRAESRQELRHAG
jgi:hypothetical protein